MDKNKMNAIVKDKKGLGATLKQVDIPTVGSNEILVKVEAAAICGTDIHIYEWNTWAQNAGVKENVIMGHEFCGHVVETGKDVKTIKVGDRVVAETHMPCGECYQCKHDAQHICANMTLFSVHTDGCFAEYAKITEKCAYKISEKMDKKVGAIMEPLGVGVRAVSETDVFGKNVVVMGCGPIGLLTIAAAKTAGAAKIIATDISANRLSLSEKIGADVTLNPLNDDVVSKVMEETDQVGTDIMIDSSGSVHAIIEGFKYLRKGGCVLLASLPSEKASIDLSSDVVFKEARIIGIHGRKMDDTWTKMKNLIDNNQIDVTEIVTHEMPLSEFETAFELLKKGEGSKIILIP